MERTFREVIANIKDGEVWVHNEMEISLEDRFLNIEHFQCTKSFGYDLDAKLFELKKKEYTFEEALESYEKGKEIEGCSFIYRKVDGKDCYYSRRGSWEPNSSFELDEVRGKWYIND